MIDTNFMTALDEETFRFPSFVLIPPLTIVAPVVLLLWVAIQFECVPHSRLQKILSKANEEERCAFTYLLNHGNQRVRRHQIAMLLDSLRAARRDIEDDESIGCLLAPPNALLTRD